MITTDDFGNTQWHDNAIHAIRIVEGEDGCAGELIFDIDFIVEWLELKNDAFSFRVAPSDLTFHEVSDLVISVDYASSTAAVQPMTIHEIHREVLTYPNGCSAYAWKIEINWPRKSFITFQSKGFTQIQRKQPITSGAQYLSASERKL
jgi:hypothetical protein